MIGKLRVLHIDNDLLSRSVVRAMLALKDVELTEAASATGSVEMIRNGGYDLVLMDLQMNDIDGMDVLHALQDDPGEKPSPVVIVTGDARESVACACKAAGARQVIHKPVSLKGLFDIVDATAPIAA